MNRATRDTQASHQLVASFLTNGRVIGWLGYFLPASLLTWSLLTGSSIRGSLSEYYYTPVRDLLVGTLCAMAVFLWSYRGFSHRSDDLVADRRTGKVAGVAAMVIAFSPLRPRQDDRCTLVQCMIGTEAADVVHAIAAVVFFVSLALFSLVLLPRSAIPGPRRRARIWLYRLCGLIILLAVASLVVWKYLPPEIIFALGHYKPIFWIETVAIWAYATAWTVRGRTLEALLARNPEINEPRTDSLAAAPTPAAP